METNERDFSGSGSRENRQHGNQSAAQGYGNSESVNDPGQRNTAKFENDTDDFNRLEDDLDNERNMSTGGFTGSETSSDLSRDSRGAFSTDDMSPDLETRHATNDSERSKSTNDDDDFLNSDWSSRDL